MKAQNCGDLARKGVVFGSKAAQNGPKLAGSVYRSVIGLNCQAADS
jgi:hypothetical protein